MKKCAKYRAASGAGHHANPAGDCAGCVYFSSRNCGLRPAEVALQSAFDLIY